MLWRFLLFIDEMQSFLLNVAVHLLNPPAALLSSLQPLLVAISTTVSLLQHPVAAILLLYCLCNLLWRPSYFYRILSTYADSDHPGYLYIIIATSSGKYYAPTPSLQPPLALLLLQYCLCNLLWRPSYFYCILSTYADSDHPGYFYITIATSSGEYFASISSLQPHLALFLLQYCLCNLLWRFCSFYFTLASSTYRPKEFRTALLYCLPVFTGCLDGLTSPWEAELYMARPEALLFFIFQILNLTPTLSTTLQSSGSIR